jgi:hypothetical protein
LVSEPFPSNEGRYKRITGCAFSPLAGVSEPFPSNEGRYIMTINRNKSAAVSEPFPSNEGRYLGMINMNYSMISFRTFSF